MIKIGEFSKMAQVPVATLRYYDQVGLLKPVAVDRSTGYRYYGVNQLPRLNRVVALKGLGLSLEQIAEMLDEGLSQEQMREVLRLRHADISRQLVEMQSQLTEVEKRLQQIEYEEQTHYEIILKRVEPLLVASVRAILPDHAAVGMLYREVYEALGDHIPKALGANPGEYGTTLVIWYDTEFRRRDVDGAAAFIVHRRVPERGRMRVHELPAAMMASTIHDGSYETIGHAHEAVLRWVEAKGYQIAGPDREINLYNKPPIRRDDPTYLTEIQYPVERVKHKPDRYLRWSPTQRESPMQFIEPKIEQRGEQPYVGIRAQVGMLKLDSVIPKFVDEVAAWLAQQGIEAAGVPLIRYHVINMDAELDITVGFPVSAAPKGDDHIVADALPAGRYASLVFTGVENGIQGNGALIEWIAEQGLQMDRRDDKSGDAFGGRVEYMLDGPDDDPNPSNWKSEVAIRLADE